jgi:hypothetical protein
MERACVILKWACALAFAVGSALATAAYANYPGTNASCWINSGSYACTDLGNTQCGIQAQSGSGCVYCNSNAGLFNKTCVYCTGSPCTTCNNTQNTMNCGNKSTGTCSYQGMAWVCGNLSDSGTCDTVYQCTSTTNSPPP